MKLRNKKTGEIVIPSININIHKKIYLEDAISHDDGWEYDSLAELNEEWEDVPEEPKEYWYLDSVGDILSDSMDDSWADKRRMQIGNYFETKEKAEKAAEKLKAWKRLKEKGFFFDGWESKHDNTTMIRLELGLILLAM